MSSNTPPTPGTQPRTPNKRITGISVNCHGSGHGSVYFHRRLCVDGNVIETTQYYQAGTLSLVRATFAALALVERRVGRPEKQAAQP